AHILNRSLRSCGREGDANREPAAIAAAPKLDAASVTLRDGPHERKADSATRRARPRYAIKTVEHAGSLGLGNAGSGVYDFEYRSRPGRGLLATDQHVDLPAVRRIAQRIIEEVPQQHPQRVGVALEGDRLRMRETEVDVPAIREWQ